MSAVVIDGTVKTILLFLGLVMMTMSSAKVFAQETDPLAGARQMMAEGKWAAACRELGQFAAGQKQSPQASEALYLKGECEFHLPGKQEDAVRTWESLAAVYPESEANVKGQEKMMNVWLARKNPAKAEQVREFLLRKFPAHEVTVRIYAQMGQAQFQQKKFKEAVASWEKVEANLDGASLKQLATARAVIVTEGDPSKLIEAAHEALMLENYALAEEFYEKFLRLNPNSPRQTEAKTQLAWSRYCMGGKEDIQFAEKTWREVISRDKDKEWVAEARWHLVQLLAGPKNMEKPGTWKQAVEMCDEIIKNLPPGHAKHEQALFSKAWLLWAWKQWPESKKTFEELVALYPERSRQGPILKYIQECDVAMQGGVK